MKNYRENELKWYVFAYLLLLIGIRSNELFSIDNTDCLTNVEKLLPLTLLAGMICTLSFVFDCLYPVNLKEKLLFLKFITTMPGKTIFTRISEGKIDDVRFEIEKAQERYKEIINNMPSDKKLKEKYENSMWYPLYRKYEKDPRVEAAQRDFLLCRDLYTTTITMFVLTGLGMKFNFIQFSCLPIKYLVTMLFITNIAAYFKAHRFVNSVIAADLINLKTKE